MFLLDLFGKKRKAEQQAEEHLRYIASQKAAFEAELAAIPKVEIAVDPGCRLLRQKPGDMPIAKPLSVTKRFDPHKLPSFVVIDTETTGLQASNGRIIELAAIRYEEYRPVAAFTTLVNPRRPIPADASSISGITDSMVKDAPTIGQVSQSFLSFVGTDPVVGYNVDFDLKFLYAEGIALTGSARKICDVLPLCRKVYKEHLDHFSLSDVTHLLNIHRDDAHRALSDCLATGKIFSDVIDEITSL